MRKITLLCSALMIAAARLRADVVDPEYADPEPVSSPASAAGEAMPLLYWLLPLAAGMALLGFFLLRPRKS